MVVTRSQGKDRVPAEELDPSSSEVIAATSETHSTETGTTATGTTAATRTTTATGTTEYTGTLPTYEPSVVASSAIAAAAPSVMPSTSATLLVDVDTKPLMKPSVTVADSRIETRQHTETSTVKRVKNTTTGLPLPSGNRDSLLPCKKEGRTGSTHSKTKALKIAKAKEDLLRLQVELAAARLAALETEDTEDDEVDDVSIYSEELNKRVDSWLENQANSPVPTITHEPKRQTEPVIPSTEDMIPARITEQRHQASHPPQQLPAGAPSDLTALAEAITHAVNAAQRPKFIELPFFSGCHQEWLPFRAAYYETESLFTAIENLNRLRRNLKGKAKEAVEGLLIANTHPADVMKTLESRFGRPESIAMMEMETLRGLPRLSDSPRDICIFATKVSNAVATLKTLSCINYLYNPEVSKTVLDKLTATLRYRYYDFSATQSKEDPDLVKLERFLKREADLCGPYALPEQVTSGTSASTQKKTQKVNNLTEKINTLKCPVCEETGHNVTDCEQFKKLDENGRWDTAKSKRLCFRCLRYRTKTHSCRPKPCGVNSCTYSHNRMLHYTKKTDKADSKEDKENEVTEVINSARTVKQKQSYLKMLPIQVKGPRGAVDTFALLDDGSTVTLMDESVANSIGVTGPTDPFKMETINGLKYSESASRRVTIKLKGLNDRDEQVQARTVKNLRISSQRVSRELIEGCKHLTDICGQLTYTEAKPQILIGQDNWHLLLTSEVRRGHKNQPVASLTSLGWVLHGSYEKRTSRRNVDFVSCIREEPKMKLNVAGNAMKDILPTFNKDRSRCIKQKESLIGNSNVEPSPKQRGINLKVKDSWPTDKYAPVIDKPSGQEKIHHVNNRRLRIAEGLPNPSRFSNWNRLRYPTARVLQSIELCKSAKQSVNYSKTKKNKEADPDWRKKKMPAVANQQATATKQKTSPLKGKKLLPISTKLLKTAEELLMRAAQGDSSVEEDVLTTLLAEVEYTVNSRSLTHVSVSPDDPEALTPNNFLLGGPGRVPQPGTFTTQDDVSRSSWRATQRLADIFWTRWVKEYLPELQRRREPHGRGPAVQIDDLVQIVDANLPRNTWIRGRVIATYPGPDNIVRTVDVLTQGGVLRRPVRKLVILPLSADVEPAPAY